MSEPRSTEPRTAEAEAQAAQPGGTAGSYMLAGQPTELERLQLQARVWEPTGRQLLGKIPAPSGGRVVDIGCGALGWLRILSEWEGLRER
jgi:hypothetical protein